MSPSPRSEAPSGRDPLQDRRIVLCVTGGIAAYKSAYLTRALVKAGARVIVILSPNAQRFVTPLTFETLSGNPVVTSTFERVHAMGAVEHIDLAGWADAVIVAPATYDILGKLHAGIADEVVSTFLSAVVVPVFLVPAMNHHMWRNPINQRNVKALHELGYRFLDPERGGLACSWEGEGRMQEPDAIVDAVRAALAANPTTGTFDATSDAVRTRGGGTPADASGTNVSRTSVASPLAGLTVLVSAGGTREAIDPVRYLGNRSSGRMGYALAAEAVRRGARVQLVSGPSHLADPSGVAVVQRVESADAMLAALRERLGAADVLLMAAAVADFRPAQAAAQKLKRGKAAVSLELVPTPDILGELHAAKGDRMFVGFALETEAPETAARAKLQRKGLDLIVANRVGPGTGPDQDTNQVWIYDTQGLVLETPILDKAAVAAAILDAVEAEWLRRSSHART
jgi:phosphopantothenoylcysteine decarboxylase/phosphopantothenate--cysteine ligase